MSRGTDRSEQERDDRSAGDLDDIADRDELRRRYYGLMQELRVLLPGVQILVAFLLTAPLATRFGEVSGTGRGFFALALGSGVISIVAFATPTVIHRVGDRRDRVDRLEWSIKLTRVGLAAFAVALLSAIVVVIQVVFGDTAALIWGIAGVVLVLVAWVALPLALRRS